MLRAIPWYIAKSSYLGHWISYSRVSVSDSVRVGSLDIFFCCLYLSIIEMTS